ncbi:MAG: hypothetical protein AVO35_11420 [Candidatus Aegiribacteria sp. MLS_C]|nr:MAG: hypothetical protein AVO35_11420 [Candidatus Aegiribacteria sp. MLS_C]
MRRTVYLLSDFGESDTYVGQMKAVLDSLAPYGTGMIDLTHEVERGSVTEGAFHLRAAAPFLPAGSVVLAVVDPGVGTDRRGLAVISRGVHFVGPDNGLFGLLEVEKAWELPPPPSGSSRTFHGRDLFAPSAARILLDPGWTGSLRPLCPSTMVGTGVELPSLRDGGLEVTVIHTDRFGNVVLWMDPDEYEDLVPSGVVLPDGGERSLTPAATYGTSRGLLYLRGSQGFMELAFSGGSAAGVLGISPGDRIVLRLSRA